MTYPSDPPPQEPPVEELLGQMMDAMIDQELCLTVQGGISVSRLKGSGMANLDFDLILIRTGTNVSKAAKALIDVMAKGPKLEN